MSWGWRREAWCWGGKTGRVCGPSALLGGHDWQGVRPLCPAVPQACYGREARSQQHRGGLYCLLLLLLLLPPNPAAAAADYYPTHSQHSRG